MYMEENKIIEGWRLFDNVEKDLDDSIIGNWKVLDDGTIHYHGNALSKAYKTISVDELSSQNLTHLLIEKNFDKNYKDAVDYYKAYLIALRNAGYKRLIINLEKNHEMWLD